MEVLAQVLHLGFGQLAHVKSDSLDCGLAACDEEAIRQQCRTCFQHMAGPVGRAAHENVSCCFPGQAIAMFL